MEKKTIGYLLISVSLKECLYQSLQLITDYITAM